MSNKRIPPAVGEFAVGERDQLLARIAEQAREIERLRLNIAEYNEHERCYQSELAALKAQPSGVVPELRQVVTDALMGMISAVTSSTPPANEPPPPFIQAAIDRAVDRIARLNSSPVSAGDENSEEGLEEWAKGKFGVGGRYTGKLYGNTDWALARVVWSAALSAPSHGEQVRATIGGTEYRYREALKQLREVLDPEDWMGETSMHAFIDAALSAPSHGEQVQSCATCNGVGIVGHSMLCPECAAAPSAVSQEQG